MDWTDKSSNDLQGRVKQLEVEHEVLKARLLKGWEELLGMEGEAKQIMIELNRRDNNE